MVRMVYYFENYSQPPNQVQKAHHRIEAGRAWEAEEVCPGVISSGMAQARSPPGLDRKNRQ